MFNKHHNVIIMALVRTTITLPKSLYDFTYEQAEEKAKEMERKRPCISLFISDLIREKKTEAEKAIEKSEKNKHH